MEVQRARFPDFVRKPDELALEYADALLLISDCPQLRLTAEQQQALEVVDEYLEWMSGWEGAALWTDRALLERPEWAAARKLARAALTSLGQSIEPPSDALCVREHAM